MRDLSSAEVRSISGGEDAGFINDISDVVSRDGTSVTISINEPGLCELQFVWDNKVTNAMELPTGTTLSGPDMNGNDVPDWLESEHIEIGCGS